MNVTSTRRITNLSIALEALSRIAQCSVFYDLEQLLRREIQKANEEDEAQSTHNDNDLLF